MLLKIKKIKDNARIPKRATNGSAGMDLYACINESITLNPGQLALVPTGIAIELPDNGCAAFLYARSGLATKKGLAPANKVGVVDCDYRGEIMVALHNHSTIPQTVSKDERIAQMVIAPYILAEFEEADTLSETLRGNGGFGSTGIK